MDKETKSQVLAVLDYWKTLAFLVQNDLPEEEYNNKLAIGRLKAGQPPRTKKLELFEKIDVDSFFHEVMLENDKKKYPKFAVMGESLHFCVGNMDRRDYAERLTKFSANHEEYCEKSDSSIAYFTFRTGFDGKYKKNSFSLSPLMWALNIWESSGSIKTDLDIDGYDAFIRYVNNKLVDANDPVSVMLPKLITEIENKLGVSHLKDNVLCVYCRYADPNNAKKKKADETYSDLGRSFYRNDLILLSDIIKNNQFGDNNEYEKYVIHYILAAHDKSENKCLRQRKNVSPKEDKDAIKSFFSEYLDPNNSPLGKWPAKYMPALMQQTAVNLVYRSHSPVFSVNGPPGTGKTTMLKEIIAHNITHRARLLAEGAASDPDSLFSEMSFHYGNPDYNHGYDKSATHYYILNDDRINNYGILVTSCNNSAVENISKDLPKSDELKNSLKAKNEDSEDLKRELNEMKELFGVNSDKMTKDVYFTEFACSLLDNDSSWGLISAALGKSSNINKFIFTVLNGFIEKYGNEESIAAHKKSYAECRKKFINQYNLVLEMRKTLVFDAFANHENKSAALDNAFYDLYFSNDMKNSAKAQMTDPWFTDKYNREREKLFYLACKVHEEFVCGSNAMRCNLINLSIAWNGKSDVWMKSVDKELSFGSLLQSLFLVVPVISTTFASVGNFLSNIKESGKLGMLIVDEAGQAQPHEAVGALMRCRSAVIVGDPKQIEPVVTDDGDMIKQVLTTELLAPYMDKRLSVQGFADYLNDVGTYLGDGEEREWVGCPLVVHRRCIEPMYTISNVLSYDGTMKQGTEEPKPGKVKKFILDKSYWIDVKGTEKASGDHFVASQGKVVLKLLAASLERANEVPNLYIISPFTSVVKGIDKMIRDSDLYQCSDKSNLIKKWIDNYNDKHIGTVHTFQGKGTDEVIFLLGCDKSSVSAAKWVNKNIVNVAATRAKYRFYIIGDKDVWDNCTPVKTARLITENEISADELDELLSPPEVPVTANNDLGKCPKCGKPLVKRNNSKTGEEFLSCSGFPKCRFIPPKANVSAVQNAASIAQNDLGKCPQCGKPLVLKKGKFSNFIGCSGFATNGCRFTKKL